MDGEQATTNGSIEKLRRQEAEGRDTAAQAKLEYEKVRARDFERDIKRQKGVKETLIGENEILKKRLRDAGLDNSTEG